MAPPRPESESKRLLGIVDSIPSLIHTAKPDGCLDYFNQRWLQYVGLPIEDLLGWKWTAAIHPEDVEAIVDKWRLSLRSGQDFLHEARVRRADGQYRWMLHHKVAVRDESGRIIKWYGSSVDIEDTKQAEEQARWSAQELQRSAFYLAEAQRLGHIGGWVFDPTKGFDFWSHELFQIHGLDPAAEAPSSEQYLALVHPKDREFMASLMKRMPLDVSGFDVTKRIVRPDGEVRYVRCVGGPPFEDGTAKRIGVAIDVTEHELLTQELRRREAYLTEAQRLSHTGSFGWRPASGEVVWSDETYRIFEYDQAEKPNINMVLQRIHPTDRPLAQQVIDRASQTGTNFGHEYRLLLADGRVKHVHAIAHALQNASSNREFIGAVTDFTERKAAEERIREQEMELRQMLDLAPQMVAVFGPNGERLRANRVALDYVGLSLEEWRQTPGGLFRPGWFIHPDDQERAARAYSDITRSDGSAYELELRVQGADESFRWFLVRYNPVRDEHGQTMRWYVAATDIEDRKRVEERLQQENLALREEINQVSMFEEIVGSSAPLQKVLTHVSKVAPSDSTVLILGETGTGKELIARAIHKRSGRAARAFIAVNCGAIPTSLIASELFGHEKGAFTGAAQRRLGRFEAANGGTIFLDEVGDLPHEIQIALLRVLQEREFERVGGNKPIPVDVRVLAATHRDLENLVDEGKFRQDLLYRLNIVPIKVPSLRERASDIPLLVEYFIARFGKKARKKFRSIDRQTLKLLQAYEWPGNVREMQNVIERAVILSDSDIFSVDETWLKREPSQVPFRTGALSSALSQQERDMIEAALTESHGRVSGPAGAAARLGLPTKTLDSKIKRLRIDKLRFRSQAG